MKIRVTLKDPDSLHDGVVEAVRSIKDSSINSEEQKLISNHREEKFEKIAYKWFERKDGKNE